MANASVTAAACANIAFIKYWGNRPGGLNLPLNPSISMTLSGCVSTTTVTLGTSGAPDRVELGGAPAEPAAFVRATRFLDHVRRAAGRAESAQVASSNSFPTGCGIASSASGFGAVLGLRLASASAFASITRISS